MTACGVPAAVAAALLLSPLPSVRSAQSVPLLATGDYLAVSFMESLQASRSFQEAARPAAAPVRVSVRAAGHDRLLSAGGLSGEECGALTLRRDGSIDPGGSPAAEARSAQLLSTALCAGSPALFRHVGDAGHWIAFTLIGGDYTDGRGRRYAFRSRGQALFAGRRRAYAVALDRPFPSLLLDGVAHPYRMAEGGLEIFEPSEAGLPSEGTPPLMKLRRMVVQPRRQAPPKTGRPGG
ncbi:MAG TPA: hypothetical protein VJV23_15330 [Candidatus Polarisedimenticolia bacterium]|nr:hypothetical protein [Candidatus Polarisedimenticolia bacterium]